MKPLEIKHRVIGGGEPLICVPVVEQDAQSVIREITYLSQSTADMIEWRVDAFRDFTDYNAIRSVFEAVAPLLGEKLFLYTFRTAHQGGMHNRQVSSDIEHMVKGVMIESYIEEGNQKIGDHIYGKSITDPCLGWEDSRDLIYTIADMCR